MIILWVVGCSRTRADQGTPFFRELVGGRKGLRLGGMATSAITPTRHSGRTRDRYAGSHTAAALQCCRAACLALYGIAHAPNALGPCAPGVFGS